VTDVTNVTIKEDVNLTGAIREYLKANPGWKFTTAQIDQEFVLGTFSERARRRKALERLKEEGLIEHSSGQWRVKNLQAEPINYLESQGIPVPLSWPFEIEKYVKIFQHNIIIIAGAKDAGKTAYLLNFVLMNMYEHGDISYFSSEMYGDEMKERLLGFEQAGMIGLKDWLFHPFARNGDFQDVIDPTGINIIDYLEVTENFAEIGRPIRAIFDKLTTGIAIIALQKNPSTSDYEILLARGGTSTMEKSRLYLSLDKGKMKIVVGKNRVNPRVDPVNKTWNFRLEGGCKYTNVVSL